MGVGFSPLGVSYIIKQAANFATDGPFLWVYFNSKYTIDSNCISLAWGKLLNPSDFWRDFPLIVAGWEKSVSVNRQHATASSHQHEHTELTNSIQLSFSGHVLRLDAYILVAQPAPKSKTLYQREDKKGSRTLLVKSPSALNE